MLFKADLESEVTFGYNVLRRIINFDETHLTKSSEGDKGGPLANTLMNLDLPRAGMRVYQGGKGHVTGVFGSSPLEVMPPIMIYETKSKTAEKMKVKPSWAKELLEVVDRFDFNDSLTAW